MKHTRLTSRKLLSLLSVLIFLGIGLWQQGLPRSDDRTPLEPEEGKVSAVVDGDTIKVVQKGNIETVRLIGMDTPETVDPRKPVQCFGREASNKAKEILLNQTVRLVADPTQSERDKYKRLLRYVYLPDGRLFNEWMIREGYAHEYTYESNPYEHQTDFVAAQKQAQEGMRGLWAQGTCAGNTTKPASP